MKIMKFSSILILVFASVSSHAAPIKKKYLHKDIPYQETEYDKRIQILQAITAISNENIFKNYGCESFRSRNFEEGKLTVGDFISANLAIFEKGTPNYIEINCKKKDDKNSSCDVNFRSIDAVSPWSCGFRFDMETTTRKIKIPSLSCLGTC